MSKTQRALTGRLLLANRLMDACSSSTIFPYKECNHVCQQSCDDRFRRGQTEQEIGQLLFESAFLSDSARTGAVEQAALRVQRWHFPEQPLSLTVALLHYLELFSVYNHIADRT